MTNVFVTADKIEPTGRLIDARFDMANVELGKALYEEGHVEGAVFWDLNTDLSDLAKGEGRHPLPEKEQLQELFEKHGLHLNDAIYVYDQGAAPYATRAWWILNYAGFKHAYVVNGGFQAFIDVGFPITTEVPTFQKSELQLQWNDEILLKRQDIVNIVEGKTKATLLDARSAVRYNGEIEPLDKVAGHIPTAQNYDWEQLRDGSNLVITSSLLDKVSKEENIVVYCGSGVTATPIYSVLKEAGYENVQIYMAGYSDWVKHHPVATSK
ncbi:MULTISPECIES: sulfurtransferase [Solibacillus]|uniref:Sulfurtransferase n=1 Tax=Solibacillus merdavium TaxID=2762218 RepID=A0ABR8XT14_9BACL|nr:sulfurtransferase [Solibacillus merdavium]MBD8035057.1 sulfurtransferase [Solibacillus merdavium]